MTRAEQGDHNMDKAGKQYWDSHWRTSPLAVFDPSRRDVVYYQDRILAGLLDRTLSGFRPVESTVLEVGCADSTILPYVAQAKGYRIAGIDYSEVGCQKIRLRLERQELMAEVTCCDVFNPPMPLFGAHDVVMSFGLVEHFTDTTAIVTALAALVRPGGRVLTLVPNMQGSVGAVQWLASPSIYRVHEALSPEMLVTAHRAAGLRILEADYMLPMGYGVVNFSQPAPGVLRMARRLMVAGLSRLSWASWVIDEKLFRLPGTALFSPYCYCIAEREG